MTDEQKLLLTKNLKENQVVVNFEYKQIKSDNDFPIFEIIYINPPLNYKLIKEIEAFNVAILENLDYEATTTN